MAEETKTAPTTEVSSDPSGPVITTKQEHREVIHPSGDTATTVNALSSIFEKAEAKAAEAAKTAPEPDKPSTDKLFEAKEEEEVIEQAKPAAVDTTKPAAVEPVVIDSKADDIVKDEELVVLPHDKPKTAKRISALLSKISTVQSMAEETKKEAAEKAKRLAELEAELNKLRSQDPMANEQVKKVLDEHAMYRRRYQLEKDPEIQTKFDSRITSAEDNIKKILRENGADDKLIELVDSNGGWVKFADSQEPITIDAADGKKTIPANEFADLIKKNVRPSDKRSIDLFEMEQHQTRREKERFFEEESKKAKDYFTSLEEQEKNQREQSKRQVEENAKQIIDWRTRLLQEDEYLKPKQAPAGATQEQIKAIEDHNEFVKQAVGEIDKALTAKSLDDMLYVVKNHVKYHTERRARASDAARLKALEDSLKAKDEEIAKLRRAGRTTPIGGSIMSSNQSPNAKSGPRSLEDAFAAIEAEKAGGQ